MSRSVSVENIGAELSAQLQVYSSEISNQLKEAIETEGKALQKDIKQTSPVRTGAYKKGWAVKKSDNGIFGTSVTVYNKKRYSIVHLVEHSRSAHIFNARERAAERLDRTLEEILENR